jgi:hypothetical protein
VGEAENRSLRENLSGIGPLTLSAEAEYEVRTDDFVMEFALQAVSDYRDAGRFFLANIVEFKDDKIARDMRYYAEPFEAPEWRSKWVDQS